MFRDLSGRGLSAEWTDTVALERPGAAETGMQPAVYDDQVVLHILPTDARAAARILTMDVATRAAASLGPVTANATHPPAVGGIDTPRRAGLTVRTHGAGGPTAGFVVGDNQVAVPIPDSVSEHELEYCIDDFLKQHQEDINGDPACHLGARHGSGAIFLGRCRIITGVNAQDEAIKLGYRSHQLALWQLDGGPDHRGQQIKLFDSGHDGVDHPQAQRNVAAGRYTVVDHPHGHRAVDPYSYVPDDFFMITPEDEAETRKLRAKYQGGTFVRGGDTQSVVAHLRSEQIDHNTDWDRNECR